MPYTINILSLDHSQNPTQLMSWENPLSLYRIWELRVVSSLYVCGFFRSIPVRNVESGFVDHLYKSHLESMTTQNRLNEENQRNAVFQIRNHKCLIISEMDVLYPLKVHQSWCFYAKLILNKLIESSLTFGIAVKNWEKKHLTGISQMLQNATFLEQLISWFAH